MIGLWAATSTQMAKGLVGDDRSSRTGGFLDAVINSADDGSVVVDDRLRIVAANRA
jgi:hypothetical protein